MVRIQESEAARVADAAVKGISLRLINFSIIIILLPLCSQNLEARARADLGARCEVQRAVLILILL